ncbi:potassium voltage-gated channel protein Shab-like [Mytilus californianus]|uniref:potassium voltage-gated channel protein Shab-like n=1 Tax=Mytilus californianus TaxID=6549 RepID=UPI002245F547|nr:potassium voltage-gated channel protein Shab-like [Mytilus californianus]
MMSPSRVRLNIPGTKFQITRKLLEAHPHTTLGKLITDADVSKSEEFYFDRPATPFESILTFYQTGRLHLPQNICPNVFKGELEYWKIDYKQLDRCCLFNYIQFLDSNKTKLDFQNAIEPEIACLSCPLSTRNRIWGILDYKDKSWIAKLVLLNGILFVLLSLLTLALSSLPRYRRPLTTCEYYEYSLSKDKTNPAILNFLEQHDCNKLQVSESGDEFYYYYYDYNYYYYDQDDNTTELPSLPTSSQNPDKTKKQTTIKIEPSNVSLKLDIFYQIDYSATAFFTLELILRLMVCQGVFLYYKNVLNVIDTIVLLGTFVDIVLWNLQSSYKFSSELTSFIDFIKFLRVFRLLKYYQHFTYVQVVKFSIKRNAKDLLIMLFHIGAFLLIFANIIYLTEDRDNIDSIPQGWWLGLVTLTTVGYGDLSPKTFLGKITCSVCALCGIFMMSMIIPIFVDTFVTLYGIAHVEIAEEKKDQEHTNVFTKVKSITTLNMTQTFQERDKTVK